MRVLGSSFLTQLTICELDDPKRQTKLNGHKEFPISIDFSPDGDWLASGSLDDTVRIWNADSGECIKTIPYEGNVMVVDFSQAGDRLFVAGHGYIETLWTDKWKRDQSFETVKMHVAEAAYFADDSKILVTNTTSTLLALHGVRGSIEASVLTEEGLRAGKVAVSPDGRFVAATLNDNTIKVSYLYSYSIYRVLVGHDAGTTAVCYSLDSQSLFAGSDDHSVITWDAATGWKNWQAPVGQAILGLAVSPNDEHVAAAAIDGRIVVLDVDTGNVVMEWRAHTQSASDLIFLPDGKLMTCGRDGRIEIWHGHELVSEIRCEGHRIKGLDYSLKSGRVVAACGDRTVRIYDLKDERLTAELSEHGGEVESVLFHPNGQFFASVSNGEWYVWDTLIGELVQHRSPRSGTGLREISFSPDGKNIATTEHEVISGIQ